MICYEDRTFCEYYKNCGNGAGCSRALTEEVREAAKDWWGHKDAPICVFAEMPTCFKVKEVM
jgi:galactitol-specific phosphotransferase system IIB component